MTEDARGAGAAAGREGSAGWRPRSEYGGG